MLDDSFGFAIVAALGVSVIAALLGLKGSQWSPEAQSGWQFLDSFGFSAMLMMGLTVASGAATTLIPRPNKRPQPTARA